MFVDVNGARVQLRELWRICMISVLTGSLYQYFWTHQVSRDLSRMLPGRRVFVVPTIVAILVSQLSVLAISAFSLWELPARYPYAIAATLLAVPGFVAIWAISRLVMAVQREVCDQRDRLAQPLIVIALYVASLAVGAAAVRPMSGVGALDIALNALLSGIVLPLWLLYLQGSLNRSLLKFPVLDDDAISFGALEYGGSARAVGMRSKLAASGRRVQVIERFDIVPKVTIALFVICTLAYA